MTVILSAGISIIYCNINCLPDERDIVKLYIYMVFTTDGLFEVAIESWPEWDLNPQPLNSVQML